MMQNSKIFVVFLLILYLPVSFIVAQQKRGIVIIGKQDEAAKRSTIVEANGYGYLGNDKTIEEIKNEALIDAKRKALEMGKVYIKSITKMSNFQVDFDFVQSKAEGNLKIIDMKDCGVLENRYRIWIKAEVVYDLLIHDEQDIRKFNSNPGAPLIVSVWTERKQYREGDEIKIFLKGNKDFYARIIYINAEIKHYNYCQIASGLIILSKEIRSLLFQNN